MRVRVNFSVIPLKNEGKMQLMFKKIYAATTLKQAAIEERVVYHSSLHKNHINAGTSSSNFGINSVSKLSLGARGGGEPLISLN